MTEIKDFWSTRKRNVEKVKQQTEKITSVSKTDRMIETSNKAILELCFATLNLG